MVHAYVAVVIVGASLFLTGCTGGDKANEKDPAAYNKCLESEAAKVLDETGSNADYANEVAMKACADLA